MVKTRCFSAIPAKSCSEKYLTMLIIGSLRYLLRNFHSDEAIHVKCETFALQNKAIYGNFNKNTPGVKKARLSRKHQLGLIHTLD